MPETRRERVMTCAVCGGRLILLIEVVQHAHSHAQDRPNTRYFRCDRCSQVTIIEE